MGTLVRLTPDPEHVVNPATGELVATSDASFEQLAEIRDALGTLDAERKAALAVVDNAITARVDHAERRGEIHSRTIVVGDFRVSVDPPTKRALPKGDYGPIRAELLTRAGRGELALEPAAIEGAFMARTRYALNHRVWNMLAQHAPEIERVLDEYSERARRYVNVERWRAPAIEATSEEEQ
jgi:hypothetical protein